MKLYFYVSWETVTYITYHFDEVQPYGECEPLNPCGTSLSTKQQKGDVEWVYSLKQKRIHINGLHLFELLL